ncbi:MAG: HAMP domain-containing protein [bacterium]|jgi:two-component system nitrogen regulation sensor histidine kinase NtrY|nr:HAMP domain-containing protein [bacterium]MBK9777561.1 HAMP domain-containing protein [bacterium]
MKRISTRLAISFLLVALLPTLPLSLVVRDLLERRFGPAIADPLELALEAGLDESRSHLQELREGLARRAVAAAASADAGAVLMLDQAGAVQPADSLTAFAAARPGLLDPFDPADDPQNAAAADTLPVRRRGDALVARVPGPDGSATVVVQALPAGMVQRAGDLTGGVTVLRAVRAEEGRVVRSFVGPFLLVYGALILVALVAGLLWSRQMVRPLEMLVGATRRVAGGDLEFRLERQGPGEVGELVASFDEMVARLAEQRRDLARLERVAAWRGMARTLAHEVKNPLTPILLAITQVRDAYKGDDATYRALLTEAVDITGEEVESLRRLVKAFGDFARLPRPELREGDLVALLLDLEQLYGSSRLELGGTAAPVVGWFDYDALRRALINLIDNGLAACRQQREPERVSLVLERLQVGARLVVSDRGAGIAPQNLARIFEPDFTTKSDGMGLGLAIVENIIIGHGGVISVRSEPGHGAAFTVDLPLTAAVAATSATEDGAA